MKDTSVIYRHRFALTEHRQRRQIWEILCRQVFSRYIKPTDTVMDIGAGYCEFINSIRASKKLAVDVNRDTRRFAAPDVRVLSVSASKIPASWNGKIDVVFMSNFLEHLATKETVLAVLRRSFKLLARDGRLIILQPNIDLVGSRYWDFFDHQLALNVASVSEALALVGFNLETVIERFLPYTTKSWLPTFIWLVKLYLLLPPPLRPFAGQSLFIARKPPTAEMITKKG